MKMILIINERSILREKSNDSTEIDSTTQGNWGYQEKIAIVINMMKILLTLYMIQLLAASLPGPDFFIVLKHSLHFGQMAGICATFGIATSICIVYCPIALFFIQGIEQHYMKIFHLVSVFGSFYLLYLAYHCLQSNRSFHVESKNLMTPAPSSYYLKSYYSGLVTNLSNPKVMIYFISILPLFIPPNASHAFCFAVINVITFSSMSWFILVACIIGQPKIRSYLIQYIHYVEYLLAFVFTGFAIFLLFDNLPYFL